MTRLCVRVLAGRFGLFLLLLALLLTPVAVQAQSITTFWMIQYEGSLKVGATVGLSGQKEEHFPATITVSWGDGSSSTVRVAKKGEWGRGLSKTYPNCGVTVTIGANVTFKNGASESRSKDFSVVCWPAEEPEGSPIHCGIDGCQHVPEYFLDNQAALIKWIEDANRRRERGDDSVRPLSDFGYRCPDAWGRCPTKWILGTGSTKGLSSPNSFTSSSVTNVPGANIQRISADGIGVKWINDQNPIDAVDVWGPGAQNGGEVCFLGSEGRLIYLDARTSPRAQSELSTTVKGDEICGTMPGPGSVAYLPPAE